jgi:hypothetical protein
MTTSHLQSSQLAHTHTGAFVMAGADAFWRSTDGTPASWKPIDGTGPISGGVIEVDNTLYANNCYFVGFCQAATYFKSSDDGVTFGKMQGPPVAMGGPFAYDPGHHVLLSSSMAGVWRVRLK